MHVHLLDHQASSDLARANLTIPLNHYAYALRQRPADWVLLSFARPTCQIFHPRIVASPGVPAAAARPAGGASTDAALIIGQTSKQHPITLLQLPKRDRPWTIRFLKELKGTPYGNKLQEIAYCRRPGAISACS